MLGDYQVGLASRLMEFGRHIPEGGGFALGLLGVVVILTAVYLAVTRNR